MFEGLLHIMPFKILICKVEKEKVKVRQKGLPSTGSPYQCPQWSGLEQGRLGDGNHLMALIWVAWKLL